MKKKHSYFLVLLLQAISSSATETPPEDGTSAIRVDDNFHVRQEEFLKQVISNKTSDAFTKSYTQIARLLRNLTVNEQVPEWVGKNELRAARDSTATAWICE